MNQSSAATQLNRRNIPTLKQRSKLLLGSFSGQIAPVKTSLGYRLGIVVVTLVMLLLPLIYLSLIALVGYCVYWHAVHNTGILDNGMRGRGKLGAVLVYITPMVVGAFLFVFMLKPIFASRGGIQSTRKLKEEDEPLLFAFVRRICDAVRAPHPKSIEVDSNVNASASFRRGAISMLTGNDLTLTIGTPLVAGLNVRQFAGVLAHEFGHFSQGAGMRLTYVIRTISFWLTRAVYERDRWDEMLVSWSNGIDLRIGWIFYVTRLFVWLTRKILWCLMMIGNAVSGFMLRQMEFDADLHETRLVGNETFESTARRLAVLNFANHGAQSDLASFFREGRLADDLAGLVRANAHTFDAAALAKINSIMDKQATGAFDTHPCDTERIAHANRETTEGVFQVQLPAAHVFTNFRKLSQAVTMDFYREVFGDQFDENKVHSIEYLLHNQKAETKAFEAHHRYFQGLSSALRPQCYKAAKTQDPAMSQKMITAGRQKMFKMMAKYKQQLKLWDQADDLEVEISHADNFLAAGYKLSKDTFSRPLRKSAEIDIARAELGQAQAQLQALLVPLEKLNRQRFAIAMSLLGSVEVKSRLSNFKELRASVKRLLPLHNKIASTGARLNTLRKEAAFVSAMLQQLQDLEADEKAINRFKRHLENTRRQCYLIRKEFLSDAYPFDHARKDITVGQFLFEDKLKSEDIGGILEAATNIVSDLPRLQIRILGQLCLVAEQLEGSVGVPLLPSPPIDEEEGDDRP